MGFAKKCFAYAERGKAGLPAGQPPDLRQLDLIDGCDVEGLRSETNGRLVESL